MSDHTPPFDAHPCDGAGAPPLTEAGAARRDAMLASLLPHVAPAARRRARRRTATRAAGGACMLLALTIATVVLVQPARRFAPLPHPPIAGAPALDGASLAARRPAPVIEIVRTDAAVLERIAVSPFSGVTRGTSLEDQLTIVQIVSDEELIDALAEAGRPSGIARSQGKAWLMIDDAFASDASKPF